LAPQDNLPLENPEVLKVVNDSMAEIDALSNLVSSSLTKAHSELNLMRREAA
jgi:hypothetical protein